jgi:hypothetical protein
VEGAGTLSEKLPSLKNVQVELDRRLTLGKLARSGTSAPYLDHARGCGAAGLASASVGRLDHGPQWKGGGGSWCREMGGGVSRRINHPSL